MLCADLSLDDKAKALVLQPELRKLAQKLLLLVCCRTAYGIAEEISGVIILF